MHMLIWNYNGCFKKYYFWAIESRLFFIFVVKYKGFIRKKTLVAFISIWAILKFILFQQIWYQIEADTFFNLLRGYNNILFY